MQIRYGFDIELSLYQPTTIVLLMDIHSSRRHNIIKEHQLRVSQGIRAHSIVDPAGNLARRVTANAGALSLKLDGIIFDHGLPDPVNIWADATPVAELPVDVMPFLMPSRYCESDVLSNFAWSHFGGTSGGWATIQAICDFVHDRLHFSYPDARETRTAAQALEERNGVCRDFAHLAIALCRAMNIPARFCNGYLGDIGVPPDPAPMDFNAWFEAYLGGRWYTFDARHNKPRIGRILISLGRDAADVAMITSFGPHSLGRFVVTTEEVNDVANLAAE